MKDAFGRAIELEVSEAEGDQPSRRDVPERVIHVVVNEDAVIAYVPADTPVLVELPRVAAAEANAEVGPGKPTPGRFFLGRFPQKPKTASDPEISL